MKVFGKKREMAKVRDNFLRIAYYCYLYGYARKEERFSFILFCKYMKKIHLEGQGLWSEQTKKDFEEISPKDSDGLRGVS